MSDNLFDRLFELFQTPGPVNWKLAHEVIGSVAGASDVVDPRLADEYKELALAAELHAASTPGIDVATGLELHPVDRATWAADNEQSFRFLIEPLGERLSSMGGAATGPMAQVLQPLGPALLGMQAGSLVGFMSHTALGQFDAGLPALDHDRRYLIVPNVEAFITQHGLDARQVRLWAASREVIHHGVLGTPWLRGRLVSLVADYFADVEFDPGSLAERITQLQDPSQLQEIMDEGSGLAALLGGETDPVKHDRIAALLLFIEGFGVWATRSALHDLIPDLGPIELAARATSEPTRADEALRQLAGIELDRGRVESAAQFVAEVERRWGTEAVASLWADADHTPLLAEFDDPVGWAARAWLDDETDFLEGLFDDESDDGPTG